MPTFVTANSGGTPATRITSLLSSALSTADPSSPTRATLEEAHELSAGQETYLERMTGDLIVPKGHAVTKDEVREVWVDLLRTTETTDWKQLKAQGKTRWELSVGMVSGKSRARGLFGLVDGVGDS